MKKIKDFLFQLSLVKKIIFVVIIFAIGFFVYTKFTSLAKNKVSYETATAEKGTLVVSVTGSGSVTSTNNSNVTTSATGVVKTLFAKDGDIVKTGDKILEIELDLEGQQKNAQAYASYLSAQNFLHQPKIIYIPLKPIFLPSGRRILIWPRVIDIWVRMINQRQKNATIKQNF